MRKKCAQKLNNAGFTLVEMIVVLIIMVILLSLSAVGIMAWQDWSKMKQLNANAESLFNAAQTQLSNYSASGSLENEVINRLKNGEEYQNTEKTKVLKAGDISAITDPDGVSYDWDRLWTTGVHPDQIISVSSTPGDYERYLKNEELDEGTKLLFKLVTAYVYDKSILNDASIIVEFSPEAAQVLAVCYSNADSLSYSTDVPGAVCVLDRSEIRRNELALGYYGVNTLSMSIKGKTDNTLDIDAGDFVLRNAEILDAIYVPENEEDLFGSGKNLKLVFNVYDPEISADGKKIMSFEFDMNNSKRLPAGMKSAQGANASDIKVKYYENDAQIGEPKTFKMPVWEEVTSGGRRAIRLALDVADVQAQSLVYAKAMGLIGGEADTDAAEAFASTYSFYRFGLDTDKIFLGLTIEDKDKEIVTEEEFTDEEGEYVSFGSVSRNNAENTAEYKIANGRHLYNVRFVEDYADKIEKDYNTVPGSLKNNRDWHNNFVKTFKLIKDIDWHSFTAYSYRGSTAGENFFFNSYDDSTGKKAGINIAGIETETVEFPSFRQINTGDSISGNNAEGNENYTISNLTITVDANERFGLYGEQAQSDNIQYSIYGTGFDAIELERAKGKHPTGLFVYNYGAVGNLTLDKHKVFGSYKTGGFVGENLGIITGLTLHNEKKEGGTPEKEEAALIAKIERIKLLVPYFEGGNHIDGVYYYKMQYGRYDNDRQLLTDYLSNELYGKNNSFVVGIHDVGGICGYQKYSALSTIVNYNELLNEAWVAGHSYVGGIIGRTIVNYDKDSVTDRYDVTRLHDEDSNKVMSTVAFNDSENYGRIQPLPLYDVYGNGHQDGIESSDPNAIRAYCFGGICGLACDNTVTVDDNIATLDTAAPSVSFKNCISYWLYTENELDELINGEKDGFKNLIGELRGSYVGAIAGFARLAMFENCSTCLNADRDNDGLPYIFGAFYTGGYAGVMQTCGFKNDDESGTQNEINVIGRNMVGGIAGIIGTPVLYDKVISDTADGLRSLQYDTWHCSFNRPNDGVSSISGSVSKVLNKGLTFATGGKGGTSDLFEYGYVGGICGFNGEKITYCDSKLSLYAKQEMLKLIEMTGDDDFVCNYAGGLVGNNSMTINDGEGVSSINTIVYGDSYVGGAVGYTDVRAGDERSNTVFECYLVNSDEGFTIERENANGFMGSYILSAADYTGGICGYIERSAVYYSSDITGDFIVHGKNYVGGFVGYAYGQQMNTSCRFNGKLDAGEHGIQSVRADGCFAGGFAGVITRETVQRLDDIVSAVSDVRARYFAGGFAGAILITTTQEENTEAVPPSLYQVNNPEMQVKADAVAGGYCGLYEVTNTRWPEGPKVLYRNLNLAGNAADLVGSLDRIDWFGTMKMSGIDYKDNNANARSGLNGGRNINNLIFDTLTVNLASVEAGYCAGGLFGYVPEGQSIYIDHDNTVMVATTATDMLDNGYSYAGGIIGRTGSRMILHECANSGLIRSDSVYYGGLCELNKGIIEDCMAGYAFSSQDGKKGYIGDHDYVGGLCGRNEGIFRNGLGNFNGRKNSDQTYKYEFDVGGNLYVGGLCGENAGVIEVSDGFKYVISVCGENYAGGICGVNRGTITYNANGIKSAYQEYGKTIEIKGLYAGLICGRNEDRIEGITIAPDVKTQLIGENTNEEKGSVGAFAGDNAGTIINCTNKLNINAGSEAAAGIAGAASGGAVFNNNVNIGDISGGGVKAGIVAVRSGDGNVTIEAGRNYGSVSDNGYAITGINGAIVEDCLEAGGVDSDANFYVSPQRAVNNYFISGRIDDISQTETKTLSFDESAGVYSISEKGSYAFTLNCKKGDESRVIAENIEKDMEKGAEISLSVNGVYRFLEINDESEPIDEEATYTLVITKPAAKKDLDKSKALTRLYAVKNGNTYSLCTMKDGTAYRTGIKNLTCDPVDYSDKNDRVTMLEDVYNTKLKPR